MKKENGGLTQEEVEEARELIRQHEQVKVKKSLEGAAVWFTAEELRSMGQKKAAMAIFRKYGTVLRVRTEMAWLFPHLTPDEIEDIPRYVQDVISGRVKEVE